MHPGFRGSPIPIASATAHAISAIYPWRNVNHCSEPEHLPPAISSRRNSTSSASITYPFRRSFLASLSRFLCPCRPSGSATCCNGIEGTHWPLKSDLLVSMRSGLSFHNRPCVVTPLGSRTGSTNRQDLFKVRACRSGAGSSLSKRIWFRNSSIFSGCDVETRPLELLSKISLLRRHIQRIERSTEQPFRMSSRLSRRLLYWQQFAMIARRSHSSLSCRC